MSTPLPEHEVIRILKEYLATLPAFEKMRIARDFMVCQCYVCEFLRHKVDVRL